MDVAVKAVGSVTSRGMSTPHPLLYEINTWPWLSGLSVEAGRPVDLGSVPDDQWDAIADLGFDAVWLMGVRARSPAGVAIALANDNSSPVSRRRSATTNPPTSSGRRTASVRTRSTRSWAVRPISPPRGQPREARTGLDPGLCPQPRGTRPPLNDNASGVLRPGAAEDLRGDPTSFIDVAGRVLANGRDPYFPAWPDVVQLNAFAPSLRSSVVDTLRRIADQCDGVRCDMAMLMMNDTFARTWAHRAGDAPADDYWPTVIPAVRETHPTFRFIAEAYWDLEWALQQQGFDFCYDKRLYDRLVQGDATQVGGHLLADLAYEEKLVRFIENHDEPRAATALGPTRERAAAVATLTQTGARLVHEGQLEGGRVRLPVFLGRFPTEPADAELSAFYSSLLTALGDRTFRTGSRQLCDRSGWPRNDSAANLVAWCWDGASRWLVVVNLSDDTATGRVSVPWDDLRGVPCRLVDPTNDVILDRAGTDLRDGLYVELGPWQWHLFRIDPTKEPQ